MSAARGLRHCAQAPTAATLFWQLTAPFLPVSAAAPILDFLVPQASPRRRIYTLPGTCLPTTPLLPGRRRKTQRSRVAQASHRTYRELHTSAPRRATVAIHNPQKDDDGLEMALEITPRAAKRLTEIMAKDANPHLALRIQVESGGCHGFQYLMSLVTLPPDAIRSAKTVPDAKNNTLGEDDTVFAYSADSSSESVDPLHAPKIVLDAPSLELLKGSKVDFTMELIGSQFKIVDNPLATSSCGCGTSFDIKM